MNITAIITTYNRPILSKRAVESVVSQLFKPKEIIVVEDSSSTNVQEWIKSKYPFIKYIKNKQNLGLAATRNVGIQASSTDWVAFLDDDDEWMPKRLKEQVKCYEELNPSRKENLACIQVGTITIDRNGEQIGINLPRNNGDLKESIKKVGASTPSSSFLFNKKALLSVKGFDEDLLSGIDHDIWMKIADAGYSSVGIRKPLVNVYQEHYETMMSNTDNRIKGIIQFVNKWEKTYQEWFGELQGKHYAHKYLIKVLGQLAAQKLVNQDYNEGWLTIKAIYKNITWRPNIFLFAGYRLIRAYISLKFPQLRLLKLKGRYRL